MEDPAVILARLYERQASALPGDAYLRQHAGTAFLAGTVRVFRFYESYLPRQGSILDWGCRHAPDACLVRAALGGAVLLEGCDVLDPDRYPVFFSYAGIRYTRLNHPARLPYADASFDAVIASGVLEHVPQDYESLKELHRVLKPKGRLIVAFLPNRASVEEWRLRKRGRGDAHHRLYSRGEIKSLLLHAGFLPLVAGYQTALDLLADDRTSVRLLRPPLRLVRLHRLTSCLCAIAEKKESF